MQAFLRSDVFKVTAYVAAVILLGAVLAPPLYWLGQWALDKGFFDSGPLESVKDSIERARITRYFNRAVMVSALLLGWPFLRWLGLSGRGKSWLMLEKNPRWLAHFGLGFAIAAGTLLALGAVYVATGWYRINEDAKPVYRMFASAIGPGLSVGFLEEFLFRGVLFALVLRTMKPFTGLVFLSAFFAIVHFLKPPEKLDLPPVEWDTGFWLLGKIFGQLGDVQFLVAELILLFCVGWVLGWARLKTRSLWLPIGLHAGWVFGVKFFSAATRKSAPLAEMLPWAGPNLRVGFNSVIVVCLSGVIAWLILRRSRPESAFAAIRPPDEGEATG